MMMVPYFFQNNIRSYMGGGYSFKCLGAFSHKEIAVVISRESWYLYLASKLCSSRPQIILNGNVMV